jgi:hypothetical protein
MKNPARPLYECSPSRTLRKYIAQAYFESVYPDTVVAMTDTNGTIFTSTANFAS